LKNRNVRYLIEFFFFNEGYFNIDIANVSIGSGVPQGETESTKGQEDTYSGKFIYKVICVIVNLFFDLF